jgi:hypothetical protein
MLSAEKADEIYRSLPDLSKMGIIDYLTMRIDSELATVIQTKYGVGVIFGQTESYTAEQVVFEPNLFTTLKLWKGKKITRKSLIDLGFVAHFRYVE